MRIARRRAWPDLRDAVVAALRGEPAGAAVDVSGPGDPPELSWTDGPSFSTVSAAVGSPPGWTVAFWPDVLPAPQPPDERPLLLLHRRFSEAALAVAVCRFAGSNVRPFDSTNPAHHARMAAILDVDDPATCAYPLVARMAALLLDARPEAEAEAGPATTPNPADRLSLLLASLGYEALWSRAWLDVDL